MSKYEIGNTGYYEERNSHLETDDNGTEHFDQDTKVFVFSSDKPNAKRLGALDLTTGEYIGSKLPSSVERELIESYESDIIECRARRLAKVAYGSPEATKAIEAFVAMAQAKADVLSAKKSKFATRWQEKVGQALAMLAPKQQAPQQVSKLDSEPVSAARLREMGSLAIGQEMAETRNSIRAEYTPEWAADDEWED